MLSAMPSWERLRAFAPAPVRVGLDAASARARATLAPPIRAALRAHVAALLAPRAEALDAARADADGLIGALRLAEPRAAATLARLDTSPFSAATTVHAAHERHPGVQAVFARRGLPQCTDCAVGADETLAEAAFGEDMPLDALLAELNALLAPT
jgi:hypothetical protein